VLPLLVRVDDLQTGASQQYAFDRSPVRIGRNPMNDLVLDAGFISQWHGVARFDERTTEYIDLGSTNGTLANGTRLEKHTPIQVAGNVELRVSSLRFFCWRGVVPERVSASRPVVRPLGPHSSLIIDAEKRARLIGEGETSLALKELLPLYQQYRTAWSNLMAGVRRALSQMPRHVQDAALVRMQREMPELAGEDEFRLLAADHQIALSGTAALSAGAAQILSEFAKALVPGLMLSSLADVEKLLARAATLLETSARAFVELRKGYEQFGAEMAVGLINEPTPLHLSKDPAEVLRYLLDPNADVSARVQELTSAYADIMIHQVALLNGMMEGVRSLLQRLSPSEIEREMAARRRRWLPFRAGALWRRFVERHREFSEEDRQLSAAVFGTDFARAYAAVVGEEQSPKAAVQRRE
jgi:predicted component of type VI protein secretion system